MGYTEPSNDTTNKISRVKKDEEKAKISTSFRLIQKISQMSFFSILNIFQTCYIVFYYHSASLICF